ncbi:MULTISPECIES: hypothetical protein [unclassified Tolypothrix]|uniref:hypothetical protein n=1 Tax=unclassified Tolypothrix TaxID=2649714 RepID=UPI0005EAADDF|nr:MULTISPECIES: hypothetical protein [unclassified Tolypothrix]BAY95980.1 hypothetical protein NIES3275_80570 [Microchaete diplosiphon NIES-3275]EKE96750.1 hypothetical protein FDUTEX481_06292 [Tolypothrix sp. PCC 7601]MBE9084937.1 hypothetical protein [Tolypothrix sp. LEGE 11397]UYD31138.1 hypothetical protein HGR01_40525 [Tolypothrix sp. PCC 7712]UYD38934.1 hypothetical protein HG267_41315 [Tolypothrix sp. PCC 7601]
MSAKIDAKFRSLESAKDWQAFKVNPLMLMGCIVVPLFVGSYAYTSWQQTKNLQQSEDVEIKYLPLCSYKRPS